MGKAIHFRYALLLQIGVSLLFALCYGGTNWLATLHSFRVRLHTDVEMGIPLIPSACLVYLSLFPMFWLSPFLLRSRAELTSLAVKISWCTILAAPFFVLLPADVAFPSAHKSLGGWAGLYIFTKDLSLEHNLFPSLHVAFAACCAHDYGKGGSRLRQVALGGWVVAVCLSTLLTHRHHVVDLIGGLSLAGFVIFFKPMIKLREERR